MHNTDRTLKAAVLAGAMALASAAGAAEIGRVLFADGDVRIVAANGDSRAAKRGDAVQAGERIQTGAGALGQVKMNDGGRVGVRGDSSVRFDPGAAAGAGPRQLALESGSVRVLNVTAKGAPAAPAPIEIKTADGDLLMREADVVVAKLAPGGDADTAGRVIVRVDEGADRVAVRGRDGAAAVALVTGKPFAIDGGKVAAFGGDPNALGQPSADRATSPARVSSNEQGPGGKVPAGAVAPGLKPGEFKAPGIAFRRPDALRATSPIPASPRTPAQSKPELIVPTTQIGTVLGRQPPSIALPAGKNVNPTDLLTAKKVLNEVRGGRTTPPTASRVVELDTVVPRKPGRTTLKPKTAP